MCKHIYFICSVSLRWWQNMDHNTTFPEWSMFFFKEQRKTQRLLWRDFNSYHEYTAPELRGHTLYIDHQELSLSFDSHSLHTSQPQTRQDARDEEESQEFPALLTAICPRLPPGVAFVDSEFVHPRSDPPLVGLFLPPFRLLQTGPSPRLLAVEKGLNPVAGGSQLRGPLNQHRLLDVKKPPGICSLSSHLTPVCQDKKRSQRAGNSCSRRFYFIFLIKK